MATTAASGTGPEFWRAAGREKNGDATLEAVLKRIAINDEVLVAGASGAHLVASGRMFTIRRLRRAMPGRRLRPLPTLILYSAIDRPISPSFEQRSHLRGRQVRHARHVVRGR